MTVRFVMCGVFLASTLSWAQDPGLRGPTSGLLFDAPSQAIRPVLGIPGSSHLGAPLITEVECASISPDAWAAVIKREEAWYLVTGLMDDSPEWTEIEGLAQGPKLIKWSADSKAVAWLDGESRAIRVIERNTLDRRVFPIDELPESIISMAVANQGRLVYLSAAGENQTGGIYRAGPEYAWTLLTPTTGAATLALSAEEDLLYAAVLDDGEVVELRNPGQQQDAKPAVFSVLDPAPTLGLYLSHDRRRLLAARGGDSPRIDVIDLQTRDVVGSVELDSSPDGLDRLPGGSHLVLNSRAGAGDPIMILTESASGPRAFFVPVGE
jgi:hypothetical protein